jgi:Zn-dependent protease
MLMSAIIFLPAAFIALVIPKYVQARVAAWAGDGSVRAAGRLSWNPLVHLDLLGTALLALFWFGWAKPLRVEVDTLDGGRRSAILIAAVGPAINFIFAIVFGLGLWVLISASGLATHTGDFVNEFVVAEYGSPALKYGFMLLFAGAFANAVMALLNLIPIPPFDFGGVLRAFLSENDRISLDALTRYAGYVFIVLVFIDRLTYAKVLYYALYAPASYFLALLTGTGALELFGLFFDLAGI